MIQVTKRTLAPDLARGFMLLFIAIAHSHFFLASDRNPTLLDQVTVLIRQTLIDGRAFPVFFVLFGYGMVQLLRSQEKKLKDWTSTRMLFRRRGWWLLLFGFLHAVTLYDFTIGIYGLSSVLLVGLLRISDNKLIWAVGTSLTIVAVLGAEFARDEYNISNGAIAAPKAESLGESIFVRVFEWAVFTPLILHQVVPAMLIGIWAARRKILDNPYEHRTLLLNTAIIGIAVASAGGLPLALISSQFWTEPTNAEQAFSGSLHTLTGYAGGLGWIALTGWVAIRFENRKNSIVTTIAALGQRSLTFYIFQSIVFFAVYSPSIGGLEAHLGQAGSDVVAWGTWFLSLAMAEYMRKYNLRGPAETLLRKLSYRAY